MTNMLAQLDAMKAQANSNTTAVSSETSKETSKADFSQLMKQSIEAVNETQQQAGKLKTAFEQGDPDVDIAQVMIAVQKASISFQTMSQVRNKLMDAYQEIKNMPI